MALPKARRGGGGGRKWSVEKREEALAAYADDGLAAAHHTTGVPKATIVSWAKAAGIEPTAVNEAQRQRTREATLTRITDLAMARTDLVARYSHLARTSAELQQRILNAHLEVIYSAAGHDGPITDPETGKRMKGLPDDLSKALTELAAATSGPRLSEVVGVGTRAVHDVQLLEGKLGAEAGVVLMFATPSLESQRAGAPPIIAELEAVPGGDDD